METLVTSSWDDGSREDIRIAELCERYKIPATFYIPNGCELGEVDLTNLARKFKLGGHTVSHMQDMKMLSPGRLWSEITENMEWLSMITGEEITTFAYPHGKYNDRVIEALKAAGIMDARTVDILNTELPTDPYRTKATIHVFDGRKEYKGKRWLEVALDIWARKPNYFHIYGHGWEVEKHNEWDALEQLFKEIME